MRDTLAVVSLLIVLAATPVWADCQAEATHLKSTDGVFRTLREQGKAEGEKFLPSGVPDGSVTPLVAMQFFKAFLAGYNSALSAYSDCLHEEEKAEMNNAEANLSADRKAEISKKYAALVNPEVDKLERLVAAFDEQVRIYKTTNAH